jgi:hypothetical protein
MIMIPQEHTEAIWFEETEREKDMPLMKRQRIAREKQRSEVQQELTHGVQELNLLEQRKVLIEQQLALFQQRRALLEQELVSLNRQLDATTHEWRQKRQLVPPLQIQTR